LTGYVDGESSMRAEMCNLVSEHRLRHGHMLTVQRKSMIEGFMVDPARIRDVSRAVRMRLRGDSVLRLRSPWGSDVEVRVDPACVVQERVGVVRPGRLENLPSGEIWSTPRDVNGVYVVNGTMGEKIGATAGSLAGKPIRFEIKNGLVKAVTCIDRALARAVEALLFSEVNGHRVGMFIIGTNVGMTSPTGDMIGDQNLPGLHLAFGKTFPQMTNATWDSRLQLVTMATEADVDLDGSPLLRNGRYAVATW
jgi:leucyl aminopeptidase (aminopeptidase T)